MFSKLSQFLVLFAACASLTVIATPTPMDRNRPRDSFIDDQLLNAARGQGRNVRPRRLSIIPPSYGQDSESSSSRRGAPRGKQKVVEEPEQYQSGNDPVWYQNSGTYQKYYLDLLESIFPEIEVNLLASIGKHKLTTSMVEKMLSGDERLIEEAKMEFFS
jgi:hypothetical protein